MVISSVERLDFAEDRTLASFAEVLRISVDGWGWRGLGHAETGDRYFRIVVEAGVGLDTRSEG